MSETLGLGPVISLSRMKHLLILDQVDDGSGKECI